MLSEFQNAMNIEVIGFQSKNAILVSKCDEYWGYWVPK